MAHLIFIKLLRKHTFFLLSNLCFQFFGVTPLTFLSGILSHGPLVKNTGRKTLHCGANLKKVAPKCDGAVKPKGCL